MREDDLVLVRHGPLAHMSEALENMQSSISIITGVYGDSEGYPISVGPLLLPRRDLSFKEEELILLERRCE